MIKFPIYLDNHATTTVDPRVLGAMLPYYSEDYGNAASSSHPYGWEAAKAVAQSRKQIAGYVNADPSEIVFTSGATESNNLAIKGVAERYRERGNHIITQVTEHKAVLDTCKYLEKCGYTVTYLGVDRYGMICPDELECAMTEKTILITVMFANNEIGTIQPIDKIGKVAKAKGVLLHVDGAQAGGRIPMDVKRLGVDLLSYTAHKMYGPKGVGALYVRKQDPRVRIAIQMHGGGHENGMRSGTLNVPGIVGFAKACEIAAEDIGAGADRVRQLRDRLYDGLRREIDDMVLNGHPDSRLPNNLHVSFPYVDGERLMTGLNETIAVSAGSACTSGSAEPSHVLKAIGLKPDLAQGAVRFGLGRFNTFEEIDYVIEFVSKTVKRLRASSPIYPAAKSEK